MAFRSERFDSSGARAVPMEHGRYFIRLWGFLFAAEEGNTKSSFSFRDCALLCARWRRKLQNGNARGRNKRKPFGVQSATFQRGWNADIFFWNYASIARRCGTMSNKPAGKCTVVHGRLFHFLQNCRKIEPCLITGQHGNVFFFKDLWILGPHLNQ